MDLGAEEEVPLTTHTSGYSVCLCRTFCVMSRLLWKWVKGKATQEELHETLKGGVSGAQTGRGCQAERPNPL